MTSLATDTSSAARHTPSVSELQAALLAARNGQFATPAAAPGPAAAAPSRPEAATPLTTARVASAPPTPARSEVSGGTRVWLLGTHGGSGVRYLAAVLPGTTRCAGKAWPTSQTGREPVVLVCRGNHRGLSSAQEYARVYRDRGLAEQLQLVGVIVSADAPGRIPAPLRRLERLLSGAVPILGRAPWEPTWRIGPPQPAPGADPLPWVAKLDQAIAAAADTAVSA